MDQELINTLQSAVSPLKEIEQRTTTINYYNRLIQENEKKIDKDKRPGVLWNLPTLLVSAIILDPLTCPAYKLIRNNITSHITSACIGLIIFLLTMIIIWKILKVISWTPQHNKLIQECNAQNEKYRIQNEQLIKERDDIYHQNEALFSKLPQNHLNLKAITALYNILVDGRADNINEAIDIYKKNINDQNITYNPTPIKQDAEKRRKQFHNKFKKQHAML